MTAEGSNRDDRPTSRADARTGTADPAVTDDGRSTRNPGNGRPHNPSPSKGSGTARPSAKAGPEDSPTEGHGDGPVGGPAARRALRSQGRRTMRRLLDAAMKAIDERGYHSTRVQDVVDIANTSHGTFYLYFSSKEDLVAGPHHRGGQRGDRPQPGHERGRGSLDFESWDHLRKWVAGYSVLWARYAPSFRSWTDLAAIDPGVEEQIRRMVLAHTDAVANRVAAAAQPDGLDPRVAGTAVVAMLDRFHFLREFVGEPVDDIAIDTLTTIIHRTLFPQGQVTATTYKGALLAESLAVGRALDGVRLDVRRVDRAVRGDVEAGQPEVWTILEFEVPAAHAPDLAERLAEVLDPSVWYCDFHSDDEVFVVFSGHIFRYPRGDLDRRREVERYGRSVGVPEAQLDWPD